MQRLVDRAMLLGTAPDQGREVDEPNVRVVLVPRFRYFIFYRIGDGEIEVVHIRHTSRRRLWEEQ